MTILDLKRRLTTSTNVLEKRQKLIGLNLKSNNKPPLDTDQLVNLKFKTKKVVKQENDDTEITTYLHQFMLVGTAESEILVDVNPDDVTDVVDDFDCEYNAGSEEWRRLIGNGENLKKFTKTTSIFFMNPMRGIDGRELPSSVDATGAAIPTSSSSSSTTQQLTPRTVKPLLVLDLDHTLLDFSSRAIQNASPESNDVSESLKRPWMDQFLEAVYPHYDIAVWSQTSWRWLETKLVELNMVPNDKYKFCFVLDKTSMFRVTSTKRTGEDYDHHVKPLQILWDKLGPNIYNSSNTIHVDDLARNFALNPSCGITISAFYRKKVTARKPDNELMGMGAYLTKLALEVKDFDTVDHGRWKDVVLGKEWVFYKSGGGDGGGKEGVNGDAEGNLKKN